MSGWIRGARASGFGGSSTAFDVVLSPTPMAMSPRAPLRSRTVGFPESGPGLGAARHLPEAGLPGPSKAPARARVHPRRPEFTCPLAPPGVLPATGRPPGPPRGTLLPLQSSYGLMRQSHHLSSLSGYLMRRVSAGCCHPLLVVCSSRPYHRDPCGGDLTHTPPCPPCAFTHFLPGGVGLTLRETRSA